MLNVELDDFRWLWPDRLGDLKFTGGLHEVIASARALLGA